MSADVVMKEFDSYAGRYGRGRVTLAELLCDAHVGDDAIALVYEGPDGRRSLTYAELSEASQRVAGTLAEMGVQVGDRVAVLLPKSVELLIALLAIWRRGAVHVPLFTAFGPDAVDYRLAHSDARLVITDSENRPKVTFANAAPVPVLCAPRDFAGAIEQGEPLQAVERDPDDMFILLYTSGTTGQPKGVEVPIRALASFHSYMRHGLDVRTEDVYWNLADPGWAYGLYYGVVGTLLLGRTILWRAMPFDPQDVYAAMLDNGITNLAGAPTVYRSLRKAGVPRGFSEAHRLRAVSSAGEPLDPDLLEWSLRELAIPIHDHYGQSELGMAVYFAHHPDLRQDPRASSMGVPAPGIRAAVTRHDRSRGGGRRARRACNRHPGFAGLLVPGLLPGPRAQRRAVPLRHPVLLDRGLGRTRGVWADRLRQPCGRRDHQLRLPDRAIRGGERVGGAPSGGRGCGDRHSGRAAGRGGHGLRGPGRGGDTRRGLGRGPAGVREDASRQAPLSEASGLHRQLATHSVRQGPANRVA